MHAIDLQKMNKKMPHRNKYSFDEIMGNSEAMNNAKELATRIATSNSTVLLTGKVGQEGIIRSSHSWNEPKEKQSFYCSQLCGHPWGII